MKKEILFSLIVLTVIIFGFAIWRYSTQEKPKLSGEYFFTHMEVGYTEGGTFIPKPEYSGPDNTEVLEEFDKQIRTGLEEEGIRKIIAILNKYRQKGMFLTFPYYAEKHSEALKEALKQGHLVGIHMHEDWQKIIPATSSEELTAYLKSEKRRVERAIGTKISIFSYGPGLSLDFETAKKIEPSESPKGPPTPEEFVLTKDDVRKLFKSVLDAGFSYIQIPKEYEELLPSSLGGLFQGESLFSMGHTYDWHTRTELIPEVFQKIEEQIKNEIK